MQQRYFGDSDLKCSTIGFGTWALGTTEYGEIDVDEASRALSEALDRGITLIDTAEAYGPYISEEILGRALGSRRKEVVLVSKVGFVMDERNRIVGRRSTYEYVISRAEGCLRRLQTDWVDLLLIHWPDHDTPYDEPIRALEQLKADGKIRYYGVSNYSPAMMAAAETAGHLAANQVGYHLFDRRVERSVLPYCRDHGIGFMAYGALAFGLLAGAFTSDTEFVDWDWRSRGMAFGLPLFQREHFLRELRVVERLQAFAAQRDRSVAQLAIAWVLSHPEVTVALVGVRNTRELEENILAAEWELNAEDKASFDRIFAEEGVPTHFGTRQAI